MNSKNGAFLIAFTAIISGFSVFLNKFAVEPFDAFVFPALKNSIVAIFLISFIFLFHKRKQLINLSKKNWLQLALIGIIGGGIPFLLFFKGLQLTSAMNSAFIHKSMFVFVFVLAFFFLKEKINAKILMAAILLLIADYLLFGINITQFQFGDFLIFLAVIFWAIETIFAKKLLRHLEANVVAFGRMFFGSVFLLSFLALTSRIPIVFSLSVEQLYWLIITSIFLFGYVFTWFHGLQKISASLASAILLIGLPITSILSMLFLHQPINLLQGIGFGIIIVGILFLFEFNKVPIFSRLFWRKKEWIKD